MASGDSTVYRRRRGIQFDGQTKIRHTTRTVRSHDRPVLEVYPPIKEPDVPEHTNEHVSSDQ